jgi:hypothetical protein
MHFFRENRPTMTALDSYLVSQHNSAMREDGISRDRAIGGVRLLSIRIPIPSPGDRLQRVSRQPLSSYPEEQRKAFYHTPRSRLAERCGRRVEGTD